jgi:hypothetical protein
MASDLAYTGTRKNRGQCVGWTSTWGQKLFLSKICVDKNNPTYQLEQLPWHRQAHWQTSFTVDGSACLQQQGTGLEGAAKVSGMLYSRPVHRQLVRPCSTQ